MISELEKSCGLNRGTLVFGSGDVIVAGIWRVAGLGTSGIVG